MQKIFSDLKPQQEWEVAQKLSLSPKKFDEIFDQDYFYQGKGAQCFVFASVDQRYVLKFFLLSLGSRDSRKAA